MTTRNYRIVSGVTAEVTHPDDIAIRRVVAVVGYAEDWAVYEGPESMTPQEIADYGNRLSERTAKEIFPRFSYLHYRK